MPGLKITLLQQPLIWMDGPANLRHFDRQLETVTGRDVIVPQFSSNAVRLTAFFWSSPKVMCISMTSVICSAWRMNTSITRQEKRA